MQQYSKYRIITICFILMFIFAIGAIYTNTKDVVTKKEAVNLASEKQKDIGQTDLQNQYKNHENANNLTDYSNLQNEMGNKLIELTDRIDNLEKTVFAPKNNTENTGVRCRIQGIANDGHFVPMSEQGAINESKENNKEVVITCIFN